MAAKSSLTRSEAPFRWSANCGIPAMSVLAGLRFDRMFREVDAIVEAYTKGAPLAAELFGPDVALGGPAIAGISYGHVNCLGGELVFPEDSEVGHKPIYASLEQGIKALQAEVDFTQAGMFPFYLDLWDQLKKAFPDREIPFGGFGAEGPITTAWCLRGHGFFTDVYDNPSQVKEYLGLVTASVVAYKKLLNRINGRPEFSEAGASVCDDVAAMISPTLWPEFVMPALDQYYTGLTSGTRSAHIEDLTVNHLHFLDEIGLDSYDPSVSEKLTPELIRDHCQAPFNWRLNSTHYVGRTPAQVEQWVFDAAAGGASRVSTNVAREMCTPEAAEKMRAYVRGAKKVESLLAEGCPREELRRHGPAS